MVPFSYSRNLPLVTVIVQCEVLLVFSANLYPRKVKRTATGVHLDIFFA